MPFLKIIRIKLTTIFANNLCKPVVLLLLVFLNPGLAKSQKIQFECDPGFQFYTRLWTEQSVRDTYDSLNSIDFSGQDFELRVWNITNGQLGLVNDVFILRHSKGRQGWQGYYYQAFEDGKKIKTSDDFFSDNELTTYSNRQWEAVWDTLVNLQILTIEPPTQDTLSQILDGGMVSISHDTHFIIELVKEDCKRSYGFSHAIARLGNFENIPEFIALRKIVETVYRHLEQNERYKQITAPK